MHEHGAVDVSAVLLALVIVVLVSLGLVHQLRHQAARQVEVRKLQQILAAESERAEEEAEEEYSSMLANRNLCAVCVSPTSLRCSRCKCVHYCSNTCQLKHWRQGHKNECRVQQQQQQQQQQQHGGSSQAEHAYRKTETELSQVTRVADANLVQLETGSQVSDVKAQNITSDGCLAKPKKILFPYERFVKYYSWDIQKPPCGLINCGNSCFANVILQCLTYTRPLAAFLLEGSHRRECRRNDWCFMCELQEHAWRCFSSQVPFSPIRILSRLRNIGNHLGYGRQEDAHEFMRFAVDSMQSICLDEFGGEKSVDSRSQETTLIQYIFGGHLQSQVKCMKCGHESNRYENMMDLAVEIQGAVGSLEDGLQQFTTPEWLDGENKYKCDRCNTYVKASKRLTVHEAPNILTIALKRFQSGKFGKLNKRVTFPESLNMSPYMSREGDRPPLYRLYAVVVHVDMLNASFFGHYICYVRDMEGTWYKIDDSKVKEVDLEKVMSQNAYMLIYSRTTAKPGPETDTGSVASSLMDVSVAQRYQRTSPVDQVHEEVHRIRPIIAGTMLNHVHSGPTPSPAASSSMLLEQQPSSLSETGTTSSSVDIAGTSSEGTHSGAAADLLQKAGRKAGKRRLEAEYPAITPRSSRSSSCPPVARSASAPKDAFELADDLPRSFGYSLCTTPTAVTRDAVDYTCASSGAEVQTPPKRQHLGGAGANSSSNSSNSSSSDGIPEQEDDNRAATAAAAAAEAVGDAQRGGSSAMEVDGSSDAVLKPVFEKGFLNQRRAVVR